MSFPDTSKEAAREISAGRIILLLLLAGLAVALYWDTFAKLIPRWLNSGDDSHGLLIVPIAAFIIYDRLKKGLPQGRLGPLGVVGFAAALGCTLKLADNRLGITTIITIVVALYAGYEIYRLVAKIDTPGGLGLLIVILAVAVKLVGVRVTRPEIQALSFALMVFGAFWLLWGGRGARAMEFPAFFLLLMIPVPADLRAILTGPLQLIASKGAAAVMSLSGIPVFTEGNIIEFADARLQVAEACSGIRSMIGLFATGLVVAYIVPRRRWERELLVISTVPIAIGMNILRVAGTGFLYKIDPVLAHGFFHGLSGWLVFMGAVFLLLLEYRILLALFVDEDKTAPGKSPPDTPGPAKVQS